MELFAHIVSLSKASCFSPMSRVVWEPNDLTSCSSGQRCVSVVLSHEASWKYKKNDSDSKSETQVIVLPKLYSGEGDGGGGVA